MVEKTAIRVRVPLTVDALLQRALPEYSGNGKAEARVLTALRAYLSDRGFDLSGLPSATPVVTGGGSRRPKRARAPRAPRPTARRPRARRPRRRR